MRIVIVGDGKIGSALAEQLSREGHEITVVDRSDDTAAADGRGSGYSEH